MESIDLTELTGKASRTYQTRTVTDDMVAARVHIAIALWDLPVQDGTTTRTLTGWVIAVNAQPGPQFVRAGETYSTKPLTEVIKDLKKGLRGIKGQRWVVTGRRQAMLRHMLEDEGFTVTGSFSQLNRAASRAAKLRTINERKAERNIRKQGNAPTRKAPAEVPVSPAKWWPNFKLFDARGGDIRIATDASSDTQTKGSMCFVASNGDYQLRTMKSSASTDELELETITLALKYAQAVGAESVHIETDSQAAMSAIDRLRSAGHRGRRWRGFQPGALSRFQQAFRDTGKECTITIDRVLGHAGDPLNEAADKIAYMGLRATTHHEKAARPTLLKGIKQALNKAT